ncbi:Rid family hydrolase (plasmid) [Embleya sp. NBC_00896]|nr:Rid family hydrolase [Embleya sp. NBC_00896]
MTRTVITTENAPALAAPLFQGIRKGPVLQVSGQLPLDPDTGEVVGTTVAEQTTQTLRNVTAVLKAGGAGLDVGALRPGDVGAAALGVTSVVRE